MTKLRINRALSNAGVASRRKAEELVRAGRVQVNGAVVRDLACQIDPARDRLALDGKPLKLLQPAYYLFYKPRGLVATQQDERGRGCVGDVCRGLAGAPKPVGRLDRASEGLMLLTNDGEVAYRLTHPRYQVAREYQVSIQPALREADARRLVDAVELEDGPAHCVGIELLAPLATGSRLKVVVDEGRNHLIRRLFAALGYEVKRLKRLRMGPLSLGTLAVGATRPLSTGEVRHLRQVLGITRSS